jgi:hypothetical protein
VRIPTPDSAPPAAGAALARFEEDLRGCRAPEEAAGALVRLVTALGGMIVPPREVDQDLLPVDVTLGTAAPALVEAEAGSMARLTLQQVLPPATARARRTAIRCMVGATPRT